MFIPPAWPQLSLFHHLFIPIIVAATYTCLWLGNTTPSSIVPSNHPSALRHYPYDHTLFHPGIPCRTCHFPKPARSKHCPICKTCISKADHHCIWINNCVGRTNYVWFLSLLLSVSVMLVYTSIVGYTLMDSDLQSRYPGPPKPTPTSPSQRQHWSKTTSNWSSYLSMWSLALATSVRIGAVTLLCMMSFPLSFGLFLYHVYLIWAGMTTNESGKWAYWQEDIADGLVWRARREDLLDDYPLLDRSVEPREMDLDPKWDGDRNVVGNGWWVIRLGGRDEVVRRWRRKQFATAEGSGDQDETTSSFPQGQHEMEPGDVDERWQKVNSLAEIVNIYDLGFWGNVWDIIWNRGD